VLAFDVHLDGIMGEKCDAGQGRAIIANEAPGGEKKRNYNPLQLISQFDIPSFFPLRFFSFIHVPSVVFLSLGIEVEKS
jgi:hypothetical protein